MTTQALQLDMLRTIRLIQEQAAITMIEDLQIVEETELALKTVQTGLRRLAEAGYLHLEKVDRLLGSGYIVSLTAEGKAALDS